jgi:molybdopterin-binding protein
VKISARNRLSGTVADISLGTVAAKVVLNIAGPSTVTATITKDAVQELDLRVGDDVEAVVKASSVMILRP